MNVDQFGPQLRKELKFFFLTFLVQLLLFFFILQAIAVIKASCEKYEKLDSEHVELRTEYARLKKSLESLKTKYSKVRVHIFFILYVSLLFKDTLTYFDMIDGENRAGKYISER